MSLDIGEVLNNRYRIVTLLGQGGMGAVYRAWDLNLKMAVAVKENTDASVDAQRQFEREATLLARLSHPNLPRVTDHFTLPGAGQYLVMDYVEGEDLESMLVRLGALPEEQVVTWVSQVCDALSYLHQQSPPVIHRDIKPANIRIARNGRAMLVDFGISKLFEQGGRTTVGARAFTPGYSPPEQYGDGSTDTRSDIYALGATLYHLLTGSLPPESIQRLVNAAQIAPLRRLNPSLSTHVEQAVLAALALPTEQRFQNAAALKAALVGGPAAATGPAIAAPTVAAAPFLAASVARQAEPLGSAPRPGRERGWAVAALALLLIATLAGFLLVRAGLLGGKGETADGSEHVLSTNDGGGPTLASVATATGEPVIAQVLPLPTNTALPAEQTATTDAATTQAAALLPTIAPPTATPVPTYTPQPTPTPRCPVVEGPFASEWAAYEERLGCALGQPSRHSGAEERFEFGLMFWRSDAIDYGQALVAFNNGAWRIFEHAPFVEGSPDFRCLDANTPAECPPTPKRGFGMMWCDIPAIRSGLGNATECERPYDGLQQTFQQGFLLRTDSGTFIFLNDGTWQRE